MKCLTANFHQQVGGFWFVSRFILHKTEKQNVPKEVFSNYLATVTTIGRFSSSVWYNLSGLMCFVPQERMYRVQEGKTKHMRAHDARTWT